MSKENLSKIFEETYAKFIDEDADEEKFMEKLSRYSDENGKLGLDNAIGFAYIEGFKKATQFMWEVLKQVIDSEELQEEFRKEMFQSIITEAQEQIKVTGKNPFDL